MRYWSTTSPAGCVQVRVMVVGSGEELLKAVGVDGTAGKNNNRIMQGQAYGCP